MLRIKFERICSIPCSGGITLVTSPEMTRALLSEAASEDLVVTFVALANGEVQALHTKPTINQDQLFSTSVGKLNTSCSSIATDGLSTIVATSFDGQVVEIMKKGKQTSETFNWNLNTKITCSAMVDSDIYVASDFGSVCHLRSPASVPIWQSSQLIQANALALIDRTTIATAGSLGSDIFDIRSGTQPTARIKKNSLSCIATKDWDGFPVVAFGNFDGAVLEYDMRKLNMPSYESGKCHEGPVTAICQYNPVSSTGSCLSAGIDGRILLHGDKTESVLDCGAPIRSLCAVNTKGLLGICLDDGTLQIFESEQRPPLDLLKKRRRLLDSATSKQSTNRLNS